MISVWPKWPAVCLPIGNDSSSAKVMENVEVDVDGGPAFVVPKGFMTDGASIPRFLWRVCGHPLETPRVYAALVHDYLYSGEMWISRAAADEIYRRLLVQYGWGRFRAWVEWSALRIFGAAHFREFSNNEQKEK